MVYVIQTSNQNPKSAPIHSNKKFAKFSKDFLSFCGSNQIDTFEGTKLINESVGKFFVLLWIRLKTNFFLKRQIFSF